MPMTKPAAKSVKRRSQPRSGDFTILPTLDKNIFVELRSSKGKVAKRAVSKPREMDGTLLHEVGLALGHSGLPRSTVFTRAKVSSYSMHPSDPTKIIRERANGKKVTGRLIAGRFRAL